MGGHFFASMVENIVQFSYVQYTVRIALVFSLMTLSETKNSTIEYTLRIAVSPVIFGYV